MSRPMLSYAIPMPSLAKPMPMIWHSGCNQHTLPVPRFVLVIRLFPTKWTSTLVAKPSRLKVKTTELRETLTVSSVYWRTKPIPMPFPNRDNVFNKSIPLVIKYYDIFHWKVKPFFDKNFFVYGNNGSLCMRLPSHAEIATRKLLCVIVVQSRNVFVRLMRYCDVKSPGSERDPSGITTTAFCSTRSCCIS